MDAGDGRDPADAWVRDPLTGEYRLRRPDDPPAAGGIGPGGASPAVPGNTGPSAPAGTGAPASASAGTSGTAAGTTGAGPRPGGRAAARAAARRGGGLRSAPPPTARASQAASGGRAAARRAARRRPRTGAWLTAAVGSLALVIAVGTFLVLHGGGGAPSAAGQAADAASARCTAAASAAPSSAAPPSAAAGTPLPPGPTAQPIDVRVTVLNGSGQFGQAESVLDWMQNHQGYTRTSNGGPASTTAHTSLVYAPNHADQARALVAALHLPASAVHGTGKGTGLRDPMVLTLGQDWRGVGKPLASPSPAPAATPSGGCR